MPVNPYAKTYGSSRRRRRFLLKIPSEDAVAEFNNALDAAATDELMSWSRHSNEAQQQLPETTPLIPFQLFS